MPLCYASGLFERKVSWKKDAVESAKTKRTETLQRHYLNNSKNGRRASSSNTERVVFVYRRNTTGILTTRDCERAVMEFRTTKLARCMMHGQ